MNPLSYLLLHGKLERRSPEPSGLLVLVAPHAASSVMLTLAAHLARVGPLCVLDGGNRFNAYIVARTLRKLGEPDISQALGRIQVARAFTCYQMLALLEGTPAQSIPTLVIDLLDTFFDESEPLIERRRLAHHCTTHLRHLSQKAPVAVSLRPPPPSQPDPTGLLEIVQDAADQLWFQELPALDPPPRMFP